VRNLSNVKFIFKQYTDSGSLIRHFRIHIGEKPFRCEICSKQFTVSSSFSKHLRKIFQMWSLCNAVCTV